MCKLIALAMRIATSLTLACVVSAQTNTEKTADPNNSLQTKTNATPQSAELNEAEKLGMIVLKLFAEKKYDEATRIAKRVLEIRERLLGPEHVLIDEAVYNLAEISIAREKYKEAEVFYQRLLLRYENIYGPENVKTAPMLQALGYLAYRNEDLTRAETLLLRALAIFEQSLGPGTGRVASLALDLADIYRVKRDFAKANESYVRAIELSELVTEPQKPDAISILAKAQDAYQCFLYESVGKIEAGRILDQYYESRKKANKVDKPDVINEYLNGRALVLPKPPYPTWAIKYGQQGTVLVRVKIDEIGNVIDAWAVCGPTYLREVSVKAARKARFSPTLYKGKPMIVTGVINYNFGLPGR